MESRANRNHEAAAPLDAMKQDMFDPKLQKVKFCFPALIIGATCNAQTRT